MCWNASVSLNTFVFGVFASLFSYFNDDIKILYVIAYLSVIIMQLIEYFVWSETFSNKLLSQIAFLVIIFQPIFIIISIEKKPELIPYLLVGYFMFIIIRAYTTSIPLNTVDFSMVPSKNGHLAWKWLDYNLLMLLIWYMFISSKLVIDNNYFILIFITIILIISIILYKDTQTWGSMWCWVCNFTSLILIFSVFYKDICTI
jgi:hypothetical protein